MSSAVKKLLCLALCLVLLLSSVPMTLAADEECCNGSCSHSPVIILPGINHSPTYLYDENDNPVTYNGSQLGGSLLILNEAALTPKVIAKLVFQVLGSVALQTSLGIEKSAYDLVCDLFRYQSCDTKGNHIENLKVKRWYSSIDSMTSSELSWLYRMIPIKPLVDEIGEDHTYLFTFNLVGDPMDSAVELDAYIENVKKQTGHSKVTLLPVSLGGTILTSYLELFGHEDIDSIVNVVACLDGTDIVADMMQRQWRLDDEYLYHQYIPGIFLESEGSPTLGYLINTLLHIVPRSALDALLTGAMSGILDTLMINCPQFWAMLPASRYEAIADMYLGDKAELKERTDAFQQARLNLKSNILKASQEGVKVNFISGSGLQLGEEMYTYFNIVASADKVNSDGIINLSSTTLGATGAPKGKVLNDISYHKGSFCSLHNHISPDNTIDVSTAVLPENTWIFSGQHHEVGYNDTVLNLTKAIVLGEVENVNHKPEIYPQFNGACNTRNIRRWYLPDAEALLQKSNNGAIDLSREDKILLTEAISKGEAVLSATVADKAAVSEAEACLQAILSKHGLYTYPEAPTGWDNFLEKSLELSSEAALFLFGGGSLTDRLLTPLRKLTGLIKK